MDWQGKIYWWLISVALLRWELQWLTGNGSQALHVGRVWGDIVENIDQDEEDGDEERHPARHDLGRDQKTDLEHPQLPGGLARVIMLTQDTRTNSPEGR